MLEKNRSGKGLASAGGVGRVGRWRGQRGQTPIGGILPACVRSSKEPRWRGANKGLVG